MKTLTIILTFFAFVQISSSQVSEQWAARYNYGSVDKCNAMTVDAAGNVYVTGSSRTGGFFTEDIATNKYNSGGVLLWSKRYVGAGYGEDHGFAITTDLSGNVYVTGRTWINVGSNNDIVTIKYNSAGDSVWVKKYNGSGSNNDEGFTIAVDASGNVYVTGISYGTVSSVGIFENYITIKYNSSGVQMWAASYNGPGAEYDAASSIAVDASGNVYVTGTSSGGSCGSACTYFDYATIKYNSLGVAQWVARYTGMGGTGNDMASQLKIDASGNVYVTGKSSGTASAYDYATIKYNSSGTMMWVSRYNGPGNDADEAYSIELDRTGNVYVTGKSYGGASVMFDIATVKYNSLGTQQWAQRFNGSSGANDEGKAITVDTSSNVYVTGYSTNSTTSGDYQTIKYNTAGTQQWEIKYTNSGSAGSQDEAACIFADNSGSVYVAGMSALDYAVVKYAPLTGIQTQNQNAIPDNFSLEQNYPNPFNPNTNIEFNISKGGIVKLTVYDAAGRLVESLLNEALNAGSYKVNFNAGKLSSGAYFYRLEADGFTETKKMLIIK